MAIPFKNITLSAFLTPNTNVYAMNKQSIYWRH